MEQGEKNRFEKGMMRLWDLIMRTGSKWFFFFLFVVTFFVVIITTKYPKFIVNNLEARRQSKGGFGVGSPQKNY